MDALKHLSSFVGGTWVDEPDVDTVAVVNPATEQVIAEVRIASVATADAAVAAAAAAFPAWSATDPAERIAVLQRVLDELTRRQDDLLDVLVAEVGTPRTIARGLQVGSAIGAFADAIEFLPDVIEPEATGTTLVEQEPVGVVVGITPWNFPLYQIVLKAAPAIAAGCTVVIKPSEVTPLSAIALAEIFESAAVPSGVFNVVIGRGRDVGEALTRHPAVDMVSLTGSTTAGRAVAAAAASSLKRVSLELGGKSPLIVLDDADLPAAVDYAISRCYINSGQTCAALTRLLVPEAWLERTEQLAAAVVGRVVVGDPEDPASTVGPLVSQVQRDRVHGFIDRAVAAGARLVLGGSKPIPEREHGWFVHPTVVSDVREDMEIAREEVFGPVLVLQPYRDDEDAIRIANGTGYGLSSGVYGGTDRERALAVARRIRAGQVFIGAAAPDQRAPFGGFGQSGYGRERGSHGIREFLQTRALVGAGAQPEKQA